MFCRKVFKKQLCLVVCSSASSDQHLCFCFKKTKQNKQD